MASSPMHVPSSPKAFKQPISLRDLFNRLTKGDNTCINSPYPFKQNCLQKGNLESPDLEKTHKLLETFLASGQLSYQRDCVKSLRDIASGFSCPKHLKYDVVFAYRWLAETFLPEILCDVGWEPNTLTWTCLGSKDGKRCTVTAYGQQNGDRNRSYWSLNKETIGGHKHAEGAFRELMKHCLCENHKIEAESLAQELFSKFKSAFDKRSHTTLESIETAESVDGYSINESEAPRRKSDSRFTNHEFDGNNERNSDMDQADDGPWSVPTPSKRPSHLEQAQETSTYRASGPAKYRLPKADYFGDDCSSASNDNQGVSAEKSRPTFGSSQLPLIQQPSRTYGNNLSCSASHTASRGRATLPALPQGSPLNQGMTLDDMASADDLESANRDSSPSTTNSTPLFASSSGSSSRPLGKRSVGQDTSPSDPSGAPRKKRGKTPPPGTAPQNEKDWDKETQNFPSFERYHSEEKSVGVIVDNIFGEIVKDNPSTSVDGEHTGCIYIIRIVGRPGYVKIGVTEGPISVRLKQLQSCTTIDLQVIGDLGATRIPFYKRVERLIHMDLCNKRHFFRCQCKQAQKKHHSSASDGLTKHGEWFAVSEPEAKKTVEKWKAWMQSRPYSEDGRLEKEWERIVNYCREHPSYYRKTVIIEEQTEERWKSFMNGSYDHHWLRRQLLDSRRGKANQPGKPSRWVSIQNNWKENMLFGILHLCVSFLMYFFVEYYSIEVSIALCALFSLFSICYAA